MNSLPIKQIPIKRIDREDHAYSLLPFDDPPDTALTRHIARIGLLHPPLLKEQTSGTFVIVAGRKRLRIVGDLLKRSQCDCLIIPQDFDPLSTLALALDEALLSGPISPLAKAVFFKKALRLCPPEEAARRFLPLMGLSPHPFHLQQIAALSTLEQPLALALHAGTLDEKAAFAMTSLSFRDRFALFDLIDTLALSVSNQRKLVAICQDLAKRHDTSIHAILADPELKVITDHPDANLPQQAALAMRYLGRQHSPRLAAAEKSFSELSTRFSLPKGVTLSHAPAFEKDELSLTTTFANEAALQKAWPELAAILNRD